MSNHATDTTNVESGYLGVVDHENELDYTEDDDSLDYVVSDISTSLKITNNSISTSSSVDLTTTTTTTNSHILPVATVVKSDPVVVVVDEESEEGELSSSSEDIDVEKPNNTTKTQQQQKQPVVVVPQKKIVAKKKVKKEDLEDGEVDSDDENDDSDEGEVKSDDEDKNSTVKNNTKNEDGEIVEKQAKLPVSDDEEGEIKSDASVEEGEVEESTSADVRPSVEHICRFFLLGQCSWGSKCKFIHKRPKKGDLVSGSTLVVGDPVVVSTLATTTTTTPTVDTTPIAILEPPAAPETAWERGLKKAKEALKKAKQLKVQDADFEDKKMNLSVEDDDFNKENVDHKSSELPVTLINEGNYENIQVQFLIGVPPTTPLLHDHKIVEPIKPLPPVRTSRHHTPSSHIRHESPNSVDIRAPSTGVLNRVKADEWHDPWQRGRSPVRRSSRSISLSPGRHSSSSRSHSGSSRSSYSSVSSQSSRSSGSSRSRSRTHSRGGRSSSASRSGLSGSESSHSSSSGSRSHSGSSASDGRSSRSRTHSSSAGSRGPVRKSSQPKPFTTNNKAPADISRKRHRSVSPQLPSQLKKTQVDMRDEKELRAAAALIQQEAKPLQKAARTSGSRREELLKQLKAVEEAIARKRAKQS